MAQEKDRLTKAVRKIVAAAPKKWCVALMRKPCFSIHSIASLAEDHCCISEVSDQNPHYLVCSTPASLESAAMRKGRPDMLVVGDISMRKLFTVSRFLADRSIVIFMHGDIAELVGLNRSDVYFHRAGPMAVVPLYGLGDRKAFVSTIYRAVRQK